MAAAGSPDVSVVEVLRLNVPSENRQAWLEAEQHSWEPWLAQQDGFLDRQLLWDPKREEGTLLISWASREQWKAIPSSEVATVQERFEQLARSATGQDFSVYTTFSTGARRPADLASGLKSPVPRMASYSTASRAPCAAAMARIRLTRPLCNASGFTGVRLAAMIPAIRAVATVGGFRLAGCLGAEVDCLVQQFESECRARAVPAGNADVAAEQAREPSRDGKTKAGSAGLARAAAIDAVEALGEAGKMAAVDADAAVGDVVLLEGPPALARLRIELAHERGPVARVPDEALLVDGDPVGARGGHL
mgnify:CR=1 FL=1